MTYANDAASQRTKIGGAWARTLLPTSVTSATYDAANQQTAFNGQVQTFDLNGNLTGDGTNAYTWNVRDQLGSISGPVPGSFVYDSLGRRQRKTINGTVTDFVFDGLNPVKETLGGTAVNLLTGLGIDEYLTRTTGGTTEYLLSEALGSTVALADGAGTVATEYSYQPFGTSSVSGTSSTNELRYTGREDEGTGVYYYRARYYHSGLQRFISEDPIEFFGGGPNLYAYVENQPINGRDPLGLTYETNARFLFAVLTGFGPRDRSYGPSDIETREMQASLAAEKMRREFVQGGCKSRLFGYGTFEAYQETLVDPRTADWSSTAAQVGGFDRARIIANANGTTTYRIRNDAGLKSLAYHILPNSPFSRSPLSTIRQTFEWTEAMPLGCRK